MEVIQAGRLLLLMSLACSPDNDTAVTRKQYLPQGDLQTYNSTTNFELLKWLWTLSFKVTPKLRERASFQFDLLQTTDVSYHVQAYMPFSESIFLTNGFKVTNSLE